MKKRTQFAASVVVTVASSAGCFGTTISNPPPPDTGGPNPPAPLMTDSYDVIVSADVVHVVPHYVATDPSCKPSGVEEFPPIGECLSESDAVYFPCGNPYSSLTAASLDGQQGSIDSMTGQVTFAMPTSATSVLNLNGSPIPLHADGLPTPTIAMTDVASGIDISWTNDQPAASGVVEITNGLALQKCHVAAQSYGFVGDPSHVIGVRVLPLLTAETHASNVGEIRVWRGNGKYESR